MILLKFFMLPCNFFFFLKEGFSFSMWYRFQYMKSGSCLAAICMLHGDVQGLALFVRLCVQPELDGQVLRLFI